MYFSSTENHLSGRGVGSDHDAGLYVPTQIESILTSVKRVREGRSLTVKQFQKLLGLMSAASNVIPFALLYMRPLQWWLKTKGFSPRGNSLRMIKAMDVAPWGDEADIKSFGPGSGGSVCDSSDIALSPLVISDSSSSARAGCYGTDLAEASSVRLLPIALLTGVLERVRWDLVHKLLKPHSGWAEYGSRT